MLQEPTCHTTSSPKYAHPSIYHITHSSHFSCQLLQRHYQSAKDSKKGLEPTAANGPLSLSVLPVFAHARGPPLGPGAAHDTAAALVEHARVGQLHVFGDGLLAADAEGVSARLDAVGAAKQGLSRLGSAHAV